jgi:hypothetical protein
MSGTLTTLATIAAASIVLALTAALVGLQMLSRYGSRASRMVMDEPVGILLVVAGILGVGFPLWATVEPWSWLTTLGFASFSWSLFALSIASYLTLSRLNPQWLTLSTVSRAFPLPLSATDELFLRLGRMQSTLLEIAAGTDQAELGWRVTLRAIALVCLGRHRIDAKKAELLQLVDTLVERTRSPNTAKGPPDETATFLSLLALASDDSDVALAVVKAVHELVQGDIQQHQPVRRSLLDEAAGLVTDRLQVLLDPTAIDWLVAQEPIEQEARGLVLHLPEGRVVTEDVETGHPELAIPNHVDWDVIQGWLTTPLAPDRKEWTMLSALVPSYLAKGSEEPEKVVELIDVLSTLVEPDTDQFFAANIGDEEGRTGDRTPEDSTQGTVVDKTEEEKPSRAAWAETVKERHRQSDAYDLLEEGVALLVSACAAPTPDDISWPGGWRGVNALQEDIERLSSIGVSLYKQGLYPPTDRVERAIEMIGARLVRGQRSDLQADELSNLTGWRVRETALEHTTAHSATDALRELAIEAWRAGFGRRSLLTIRRLISIITVVIENGDPGLLEDIAEDLQLSVIRTAKWTDDHLAERARSRQLVLGIAPELMAFGQTVKSHTNDELWRQVFITVDTIAWSPADSEIEAATDIYLYFLSGTDPADERNVGRPWDIVHWERRPVCQPRELLPKVREHLLHGLQYEANSDQPGIALLDVIALWRDVLLQDDRQTLEVFRDALTEHVLDRGRRDFELPTLWSPTASDRAPQFDGPRIHWRLFDVASEAYRWACKRLDTGEATPAVLPPVTTPDAHLRSLITTFGAEKLVDERQYWGIESGDDYLVVVEEVDRSRRLLRDCEERARAQFTWGYGGTGPHNLGSALVADILGTLAYCPSCFGAIAAGGGLVKCPSCDGDGLQNDLWSLHRACYHVTASLPKKPDPSLQESGSAPSGAQWRLSRTDLLQRVFQLVDELAAQDEYDDDPSSEH